MLSLGVAEIGARLHILSRILNSWDGASEYHISYALRGTGAIQSSLFETPDANLFSFKTIQYFVLRLCTAKALE